MQLQAYNLQRQSYPAFQESPRHWSYNLDLNKLSGKTLGRKCPFCEINKRAYEESTKTTDPVVKKNLQEISLANHHRESVICRCIERGKEEEGVKFWKFNIRSDKTDPYNQIIKLVNLRKENAERKGKVENILDIYNGRDLTITFTEGGTSAPTIVDDMDRSPLSENEELMRQWIYDSKRWQDVFTCKPYEFTSLVAQMKTPWFDRENGVWVDKDEFEGKNKKETAEIDSEIKAAKDAVLTPAPKEVSFADSLMIDDENLPY
jgi:hypothetical protein